MNVITSRDKEMATVSLQEIKDAREVLKLSEHVFRTPLVRLPSNRLGVPDSVEIYAKMENMQNTGSFKVRGLINMLAKAPKELHSGEVVPITMSGGNFARSFAHVLSGLGLKGKVIMPDKVPKSRVAKVRELGMEVELHHVSKLQSVVDAHVAAGSMVYLHPFDDPALIAGHGSAGLEVLEDCPGVEVVVVCCGGGGLLAGVAAAVKQSPGGEGVRLVGVEPQTAPTMHRSVQEGSAVTMDTVHSVAAGLCPPYAGVVTFRHVRRFVDDVVLVSDKEILAAGRALYGVGLVVEPSGAAALAAVREGRLGRLEGKRVVVTLSGSNVTPEELQQLYGTTS